ncbi:hypothetical protein ACJIZ3_011292 [Penstemon smallii]|uniref:YDG domain-containing protein n=1 Tax=Penstemon smallii TaxID=265156 RepID=A0ABD3UJ39_9LAMI
MVGQKGKKACAFCRKSIPPKMAREPRINSTIVMAIRMAKLSHQRRCSKDFVTVPLDHFGPITPENDPERKMSVLVGETWKDRMECRQWGAHFPHVAGICGQSEHRAHSVALSGDYEDDEDHEEWFLYTGSYNHLQFGLHSKMKISWLKKNIQLSSDLNFRFSCRNFGFSCHGVFILCKNELKKKMVQLIKQNGKPAKNR